MEVAQGYWEMALLHVDMKGKALFFKTISVQQNWSAAISIKSQIVSPYLKRPISGINRLSPSAQVTNVGCLSRRI
jgi:hypothetical protein